MGEKRGQALSLVWKIEKRKKSGILNALKDFERRWSKLSLRSIYTADFTARFW
jgi:hypothetical protein